MADAVGANSSEGLRSPSPRTPGLEPALLLVGAGSELQEALSSALGRHGLYVETSTPEEMLGATVATAPDLILLAGYAARDGGTRLLKELAASPLTSVVPVALLQEERSVDARLKAFRHGAVAVVAQSASIDAIAETVANLAREIPERASSSLGQLGESTLRDFVDALARELRQGVLSVKAGESEPEVRLVLGEGRPLVELVDDFVARVRQHVVRAEPLRYEFDERPTGTVAWLGRPSGPTVGATGDLSGVPLALADPDAARADVLAQALRERGATVMVTDLAPQPGRYSRLRQMDPLVLLIGASDIEGRGYELLRQMKYDPRLRWTSLLVVEWSALIPEVGLPSVERLVSRITNLTRPLRTLQTRVSTASGPIGARLESIGPAHLLRLLAEIPHGTRLEVQHRRLRAAIDVAGHLVAGATATRPDAPGEVLQGPLALAALLQLGSGRVRIDRVAQPASTNLMGTLASALDLADREVAPILPSLPSPGWSEPPKASHDNAIIPPAPKLPDLERRPAQSRDGGEGTAQTELAISLPLRTDEAALPIPLIPPPRSRAFGSNDAEPFESPQGNFSGPHRAPARTVVGLGSGANALERPAEAGEGGETVLAGMPSPNRDYDTLIEDLIQPPEVRRAAALEEAALHAANPEASISEPTPEAAPEPAPSATSAPPIVSGTNGSLLASLPATHAAPVYGAPTPSAPEPGSVTARSLTGPGFTLWLSRPLLRIRPNLTVEEARSLVVLGLVATVSLVAAFVVAFSIGTLSRSDDNGAAPRAAASVSPPGARRETGASSPEARSPVDRGTERGVGSPFWPPGAAADHPAPTCQALEDAAKDPFQRYPGASFDQVALGRKALVRGEIDRAHVAYCRALLLDAQSRLARAEMARLLILRRDGRAAERQARSALELEPKSRVVRGVLGDALSRLGRYDEARDALLYESQADSSSHYALQSLGDTMLKRAEREEQKGSWVEAERFYRRALTLDPTDARGAAGLAGVLLRLGDKPEAIAWARYAGHIGGLGPREMDDVRRVLGEQAQD